MNFIATDRVQEGFGDRHLKQDITYLCLSKSIRSYINPYRVAQWHMSKCAVFSFALIHFKWFCRPLFICCPHHVSTNYKVLRNSIAGKLISPVGILL